MSRNKGSDGLTHIQKTSSVEVLWKLFHLLLAVGQNSGLWHVWVRSKRLLVKVGVLTQEPEETYKKQAVSVSYKS